MHYYQLKLCSGADENTSQKLLVEFMAYSMSLRTRQVFSTPEVSQTLMTTLDRSKQVPEPMVYHENGAYEVTKDSLLQKVLLVIAQLDKPLALKEKGEVIVNVLRAYDARSAEHTEGVVQKVILLSQSVNGEPTLRAYHMTGAELRKLIYAAIMHDFGKVGIPLEIINKPDVLTPEERLIMNDHPKITQYLLHRFDVTDNHIHDGAVYHHEQPTGKGYPFMVKNLSKYPRIISVMDMFDALSSTRAYKKAFPLDTVKSILQQKASENELDSALVRHIFSDILLLEDLSAQSR